MFSKIALFGRFVAAAALVLLTVIVAGEVVLRSLIGVSYEGMEELSGYLLVAITYLAAADSFASDGFMRVAFLYDKLKPKGRKLLDRILSLVGAVLCGGLTVYFVDVVRSSIRNGVVSPTFDMIPVWVPQSVMVLGMTLLSIACIRRMLYGPPSQGSSAVHSTPSRED
jgi:TRAP-type C4-dicarboxylate transport system permease small subunit